MSTRPSVGGEPRKPAMADFCNRCGVGVALGDAAHVHTTLNLEESVVTPAGSPRVLHEPVVQVGVRIVSVANSQNGMVNIIGTVLASFRGVDASFVIHEIIVALEGDRDGLLVDGSLEFSLVEGRDVHGVATGKGEFVRLNRAVLVDTLVRIVCFGGDAASVVDIFEGV